MTDVLLLFLAVYFLAVGAAGNGRKLWDEALLEVPGFLPWVVVIGALGFLATNKDTEALGKPIVALLFTAYILKNWPQLQQGLDAGYQALQQSFKAGAAIPAPKQTATTAHSAQNDFGLVPNGNEQTGYITPMEAK